MNRFLRLFFEPLSISSKKSPAVLSGYLIYLYLFLATLDFYQDVKEKTLHRFTDYFQNFDALIWMWLLAWALVKVIEYRTKGQIHEKNELEHQQALKIHLAQIDMIL